MAKLPVEQEHRVRIGDLGGVPSAAIASTSHGREAIAPQSSATKLLGSWRFLPGPFVGGHGGASTEKFAPS